MSTTPTNSLTVGGRGPTLLEDFHAREKITHFDHERIPERVVHARGAGAYGYFEPYDDSRRSTPWRSSSPRPACRHRCSCGSPRGRIARSADTVRDVRGFATKFYTEQGNYDLVGNNFPVFFIQDGIKFPDFVHAVKPGAAQRDSTGSLRARHVVGLRLAAAGDVACDHVADVRPGVAAQLPDDARLRCAYLPVRQRERRGHIRQVPLEAQTRCAFACLGRMPEDRGQGSGLQPPRSVDSIEAGDFPEWELGVQLVPESDEFNFAFDLLDATKIIPEEQVPCVPSARWC